MTGPRSDRQFPQVAVLALLAVAEFMLTLDLSIVNVALPAIRRDLGFSQSSLQWVVNGYALAFAGFLLLGGRAADLFGRRPIFLAAMSGFTAASLAAGLATSEFGLVVARVGQGLSAAVLAPATLSILTATYQEPEQRNRALSIWTAVAIGGGAVGGLVGGLLTAAWSWRGIFFVNVPVGVTLLAFAAAYLPRSLGDRTASRGLDVTGATTITAALTALVWALIRTDVGGWTSGEVLSGFAVSAFLLGAFVVIETRVASAPLVPFSVFRSRLVLTGNLLSFLSFVPVMATWYFLSLYLQGVRGYTPLQAGLIFLPISLAVIAGSQVSFRLVSRLDARLLFAAGALVAAGGMGLLAQLSVGIAIAWAAAAGCVAMIGGGLMFAPITVAAITGAAPEQGGLASGLLNTTRQVGGALGLAALAPIAAVQANHPAGIGRQAALTVGYAQAFTVAGLVFLVTAVIGAVALPGRLSPAPGAEPPGERSTDHTPAHLADDSASGPRSNHDRVH